MLPLKLTVVVELMRIYTPTPGKTIKTDRPVPSALTKETVAYGDIAS